MTPDYGRRGLLWTFGALEPATGDALTTLTFSRRTPDFLAFLDEVVAQWSTGSLILILDNLVVHRAMDVQLWVLAHPRVSFLFQPTYSPWLNLIEPWWKTLRSLALHGRRFQTVEEMATAIRLATAYWLAHRHPYRWHKPA